MRSIKTKKRQKTTRFCLAITLMLLLHFNTFAQKGLFQRGVTNETYYGFEGVKENRSLLGHRNVETTGIINNQTFGQPVPIGSGVMVLIIAGTIYAVLKRKEDEK